MKRLIAITGVIFLSTAVLLAVASAGGGSFATTPKGRTLNGRWSGIGYTVGQGNCPTGYQQNFAIGKGLMTLTGKSEWFSIGCIDAFGHSVGDAVITASNGDLIFLTFEIQLIPDSPGASFGTWTQETEITGGTGRFEGVTGGYGSSGGPYRFIGQIDVWAGTNEGEIFY